MGVSSVHAPERTVSAPRRMIVGAIALVVITAAWAALLRRDGVRLHLGFAPFYGAFEPRVTIGVVVTVLVGWLFVTNGVAVAERLPWRMLLFASWPASAAWALALNVATGPATWTAPLKTPYDYWADIERIRGLSLGEYVRGYIERFPQGTPVHVRGHPPGLPVLYGVLDRVGLGGTGWAAATLVVTGATVAPAVLLTARLFAGQAAARRAAPFVVLAPSALFVATTGDALFSALAAWTITLGALAMLPLADRAAPMTAVAFAAGALGALGLHFTYGLVPLLALLMAAVAIRARRWRPLVPFALGGVAMTAAWTLAGFWWFDGLNATRHEYRIGVALVRPYGYFLVAGVAVAAAMVGPAVLASLPHLRFLFSGVTPLVVAALAAMAVADISGLSKGEVERIWLPFYAWIALAVVDGVASGARSPGAVRGWLAAQAAVAVVGQLIINWEW